MPYASSMHARSLRRFALGLTVFFLAASIARAAASDSEINELLAASEPPPGVVFEIVSGSNDALRWALPLVSDYTDRLRSRFPGLSIAVVSHGSEQFALLEKKEQEHLGIHKSVRDLTAHKDVSVHVCGTFASWRDITPEEFAKYVDVAASGPAKLNDYRALGYVHILLRKP